MIGKKLLPLNLCMPWEHSVKFTVSESLQHSYTKPVSFICEQHQQEQTALLAAVSFGTVLSTQQNSADFPLNLGNLVKLGTILALLSGNFTSGKKTGIGTY